MGLLSIGSVPIDAMSGSWMLKLPLNALDKFTVDQPSAIGVSANDLATKLSSETNESLDGLEDMVDKFYDLHNQAEASRMSIEKFLLGTSCKAASVSQNCLLLNLPLIRNRLDFI